LGVTSQQAEHTANRVKPRQHVNAPQQITDDDLIELKL
jgi:hypothetical protein